MGNLTCGRDGRLPLLLGVVIDAKRITSCELDLIGDDLIFKDILISCAGATGKLHQ